MKKRINAGYIITHAISFDEDTEFVLGENPKTGLFVTWECKNKTDYFWGHYTNKRGHAIDDLFDRAAEEMGNFKQEVKNVY